MYLTLVTAVRRATLLSLCLVFCCTGCQSLTSWSLPKWGRTKTRPPIQETTLSADPLSAGQVADVQVAIGRSAEARGDVEAATQAYREALKKDDSRADAYHRLALIYDRQGESETAQALYRDALARDAQSAEIHCDYAYNQYLRRQWDEAETGYRTALQLNPEFDRAHNNYAMLLARTGRASEALVHFQAAGLSESQARSNLAFALMMEQQFAQAQNELQAAARVDYQGEAKTRIDQLQQALYATQTALAQKSGGQVQQASYSAEAR